MLYLQHIGTLFNKRSRYIESYKPTPVSTSNEVLSKDRGTSNLGLLQPDCLS